MSRVLCVWELGGGTGHLHHLAPVVAGLRARGHDIALAVRDLSAAGRVPGFAEGDLFQAPVWLGRSTLPPAVNHAELLNRVGYANSSGLAGLVRAWRALYRLAQPDLVLAEHSPTALLAARIDGLACVELGTGFTVPPATNPMPDMRPWRPPPEKRLVAAEHGVLERINQVVAALGGARLAGLADLFESEERFLCSFEEFDHYGRREGIRYRGSLINPSPAVPPDWPPGEGQRLFVNYRGGYPHFARLMSQLAGLGLPTLVVADDASPATVAKFATERLRIVTEQVDLAAAARDSELAICHAGHGTCAELLRGGCPLLLLPVVVEQTLIGYRLAKAGLGLLADPGRRDLDYAALVRRGLAAPRLRDNARAFAAKYAGFDAAAAADEIVARCDAILAGK